MLVLRHWRLTGIARNVRAGASPRDDVARHCFLIVGFAISRGFGVA